MSEIIKLKKKTDKEIITYLVGRVVELEVRVQKLEKLTPWA